MDQLTHIAVSIRDLSLKLDRVHSDVSRLVQQKVPDKFVPLNEATRYLHCGRDWLIAQIKGGVLRSGIDYLDRSSGDAARRRYFVNPVSAMRWLNGAQPVSVRSCANA